MTTRIGRLLLVSTVLLAGCDRTPTDPVVDEQSDLLGAAASESLFAPSPTSLSSLLRTAVAKVEREQGTTVARQLLANWTRLNEELQAAARSGNRQVAQAKLAAVRAEEIRIVLLVLGTGTAERTITTVATNFAHTRIALSAAEAAGKDVSRTRALVSQVSEALVKANGGLQTRNYAVALDYATQASDLLDALNRFLLTLSAIPTVETLLNDAVAKVTREQGREAAVTLLATLTRLNEEVARALRAGDRQAAQAKLEAARKEQIRIVLLVLGNGVAQQTIERVEAGITSLKNRLSLVAEPRIVQRGQTMLAEAASLNTRAKSARAAGDHATALDLAGHAAGLLNALTLLLPR